MVYTSAEKLDFSTKLYVVKAESDKLFEKLAAMWDAFDRVEWLVWSIVGLSIVASDAFINRDVNRLVENGFAGLEGPFTGSQFSCPYNSTHISGVGVTSIKVQGPSALGGGDGGVADANLPTLNLMSPWTHPTEASCGCSKKACR